MRASVRVRVRALLGVTAIVLSPVLASAQVIRGTVVDATQRAVPGVVVMLVDSNDVVVARALSSDAGEYRVVAPGTGSYRLRALRIGFQPTTTDVMSLTAGTVRAEMLVMNGVRVMLDAIRVVDRGVCGRQRASDSDAIFSAWDQATTSIAATTLTSSGRGLTATTMQLERVLEPDGRRVREQTANVRTDFVRQPWRSMAPDSLRRNGYTVVDSSGATTYYAPGLEVLVSPNFLEDHCLRLVAASDTSEVGVAFEPTNARRSRSEIRGTLWLSRATADLRRLDFQFTEVPHFTARIDGSAVAGGSMRFTRLEGGAVLVSSWDIRMPQFVKDNPRAATVRVGSLAVSGGELVVLRRGADTLFKRAPLAVRGTVRDSVSGRALGGAVVALLGTNTATTSDASGTFVLPDVLLGDYTITVRTPSLDSVKAASASPLLVAEGMPPVTLKVPTATQLALSLCGPALSGSTSRGKGGVLGVVRHAGDTIGVPKVKVVADWFETTVRGSSVTREGRRMETRTDASGAYRLCGVPTETELTVRALPDSARAQRATTRLAPDQRFASLPLLIDRSRPATATLKGSVVADSTFRPLADVDVAITALSLSTRTNARGEFALGEIPAGTHEVTVRRVGYGAIVTPLTFVANEDEDRRMVLRPLTVLDSVEVVATRIDAGLKDFEDNRKVGLGHFMTRDDLAKNIGRKLGDVVSMMPSAGVVRGRVGAWALSKRYVPPICVMAGNCGGSSALWTPSREERLRGMQPGCYAQVYIDRQLMNPGRPTEPYDLNSFAPDQIEALEWYASPAQTPSRYNNLNSVCGVIVIHTRRFDSVKKP